MARTAIRANRDGFAFGFFAGAAVIARETFSAYETSIAFSDLQNDIAELRRERRCED